MVYDPACDYIDDDQSPYERCRGEAHCQVVFLTPDRPVNSFASPFNMPSTACRRHALSMLFNVRFGRQLRFLPADRPRAWISL